MIGGLWDALDGFLAISFVGWMLVWVIYLPATLVLIALGRTRWKQRPRVKAVAFAILYLPLVAGIAEAVYVDWRFRALCETAGERVKRTVVVDGFFFDSKGPSGWEVSIEAGQAGYRFIEWVDDDGSRFWRSEPSIPGDVRRTAIERPTAQYAYRSPPFASPYGHLVQRRESAIIDRRTGEVIATHVIGYRYPAFIDALWSQFMGSAPQMCGLSGNLPRSALLAIDRKDN